MIRAWCAQIAPYSRHEAATCFVESKDELAHIPQDKITWTALVEAGEAKAVAWIVEYGKVRQLWFHDPINDAFLRSYPEAKATPLFTRPDDGKGDKLLADIRGWVALQSHSAAPFICERIDSLLKERGKS